MNDELIKIKNFANEIKNSMYYEHVFDEIGELVDAIPTLIEQVAKYQIIREIINDEYLTKSETVNKISKIVNA